MKQKTKIFSVLFILALLLVNCDAEEAYIKEQSANTGIPVIKTLTYKQADETFKQLSRNLNIEKNLKTTKSQFLQARTTKDTWTYYRNRHHKASNLRRL